MLSKLFLLCFIFLVTACTTTPQAPVIERNPTAKEKPTSPKSLPKSGGSDKDWRPDTYVVKKGDTLFSLGLEFGYDYKDIAQANNIEPPYIIHLGQQLRFQSLKQKDAKPAGNPPASASTNDGDVIIKPLSTDAGFQSQVMPVPDTTLLTSPKAIREPYSDQAMMTLTPGIQAKSAVIPVKPAESAKPDAPKAEASKPDTASTSDDSVEWGWPTNGKVTTGYNESNNAKGIDIDGVAGQAVNAAGNGRVIYSGSDLRGYGKLVIIKHNKNFLSVYAHNSKILVNEGQQVTRGQKIAEMGNSDSDKVSLHFEIREQGKSVDPVKYLPEGR